MGQKCCRPKMRQDPKHTELLNLIYTQTPSNVKIVDHEAILEYVNKKGYLKVLSDYLSSKQYYINATFVYCKNKLVSVRSKSDLSRLFYCYLTSEVVKKLASTHKQLKSIQNQRYEIMKKSNGLTPEAIRIKQQIKKEKQQHSRHISKDKKKKNSKVSNFESQFQQQQKIINILDVCNEIMKQILNVAIFQQSNILAVDHKIEATWFKTLFNAQSIISKVSQDQQKFVKVNYTLVKEILDNQIYILGIYCKQQNESEENMDRNFLAPPKIVTTNHYNNMPLAVNKSPVKVTPIELKQIQYEMGKTRADNHLISHLPSIKIDQNQLYKMMKYCVTNYYRVMYKANIHQANKSLSKDIVKVHMPILLESWANLMQSKLIHTSHTKKRMSQYSQVTEKNASHSEMQNQQHHKKSQRISQIQEAIQSVILQLFSSYFTFRQSQYIYRQLIKIFDKLNFNRTQIVSIQRMVFIALKNHQLRDSVIFKWFDYLIQYLSIITITVSQPTNQNLMRVETPMTALNVSPLDFSHQTNNLFLNQSPVPLNQKNYLAQMNLNTFVYSNQRNQYPNWYKQQNISGCLNTILRWIKQNEVKIQQIINYKRNKLITSLLVNLVWGSELINKQIHNIIQILIENDIRSYGYLVDVCILLVNKLNNFKEIPDEEQGWDYFIKKWNQMKQLFAQQSFSAQNQGNGEVQRASLEKIKFAPSIKNKFNPLSISLKIKRKTTYKELDIQLIPLQKFINQVLSMVSYPYLRKIINHSSQIMQNDIQNHKKMVKRYSLDNNMIYENQAHQIVKQAKRQDLKSPTTSRQFYDQTRNQNTNASSLRGTNNMTNKNGEHEHKLSKIQTPEIRKKYTNYSLCFSVFQESLQLLFKNLSLNNSKASYVYRVKLIGLLFASNFSDMIRLIGRFDNTNMIAYNNNSSNIFDSVMNGRYQSHISKKNSSHILQTMFTVNKYLARLYHQIEGLQKDNNQQWQRPSSITLENQRQSMQRQRTSQHSNSPNTLDEKPRNHNFKNVTKILDSVHTWIYPSISFIIFNFVFKKQKLSAIQKLSRHQKNKQVDSIIQDSVWKIDRQSIKKMEIVLNISVKVYFKYLLELTKQKLDLESQSQVNQSNRSFQIPNRNFNRQYQMQNKQNFHNYSSKNKNSIRVHTQNNFNTRKNRPLNQYSENTSCNKNSLILFIQLFSLYLEFYNKWNGRNIYSNLPHNNFQEKSKNQFGYAEKQRNIFGKQNKKSNILSQKVTSFFIEQFSTKIIQCLQDLQKSLNQIKKVENNFLNVQVQIQNAEYMNRIQNIQQIVNRNENIKIDDNVLKKVYNIVNQPKFLQIACVLVNQTRQNPNLSNNQAMQYNRVLQQIDRQILKNNYQQLRLNKTLEQQSNNNEQEQVAKYYAFKKEKSKLPKKLGQGQSSSSELDKNTKISSVSNTIKGTVASTTVQNMTFIQSRKPKQQSVLVGIIYQNNQLSLTHLIQLIQQSYLNDTSFQPINKSKSHFNLNENFLYREGSVKDSQQIKQQSVEESFGQVYRQIKKY